MKSFLLTTTLLAALLFLVSLPTSTVGLPKTRWPKPSELGDARHHLKGSGRLGDYNKVGWACTSVTGPNSAPSNTGLLPGLPNTPELSYIPGLPNIPRLRNIPGPPSQPDLPRLPDLPLLPPHPGLPSLPDIPRLPDLPLLPPLPGLPSLPDIPRLPDLPLLPPLPGLPSVPDLPRLPDLPPLPGLPRLPDLPGLPRLPDLPRLPPLPSLPSLPGLPPLPPYQSVLMSVEMEKCLMKDGSKTTEKCFSQIFLSWADKDFALDKECCEIVVKMDKKCNRHVHMLLKSRFFVPLLQYSCHIKHTKN